MPKATDLEMKVLYFLVEKLQGHSVTIVRPNVGQFTGFSVGKNKSLVLRELVELIKGEGHDDGAQG